ncbi:MAG: hypothetical protein QOH61_90 [Chloroflexota bacterium]|nr:hypothetical protein [Chloroflexota bacterium]
MPTHNRADVVGYAIRSVLAQTLEDFELLIVGDGCTDGTAAVVQAFRDPRIRWFDLPKAPNFGYANRNVALREARGELMAFAAHDDLLLNDHLELMDKAFEPSDVDWAYSRPVWVSDDGTMVPFAVDLRLREELDHFLTRFNTLPASCVVYRRSCIARFGDWPVEFRKGGDWEYWKRILRPAGGTNLAYVESATALHFRASWRTTTGWGPPPLSAWLHAAEDSERWPASLRVAVGPRESPQAALWGRLAADPAGTADAIRTGTVMAMDRLAWAAAMRVPRLGGELASIVLALAAADAKSEAASVAVEALAMAPDEPRLHHAHGIALLGDGRPEEAEAEFRRAVELAPDVAGYRGMVSMALHRQGRTDAAVLAAQDAIDVDPQLAWVHGHLGRLLANQGLLEAAATSLREALRLDGTATGAARALAEVLLRAGNLEDDALSPSAPEGDFSQDV